MTKVNAVRANLFLIVCLLQACATHGPRCEGPLQPINPAQHPRSAHAEAAHGN